MPDHLELLRRNVAPWPEVIVHPVALSDRRGEVELQPGGAANTGHARIMPGGSVRAQAETLDSFALEDVRLLKVDVEGSEPQVLAGAAATIARWHPLVVIEDWEHVYAALMPGYRLAAEWELAHQTFLYEWGS